MCDGHELYRREAKFGQPREPFDRSAERPLWGECPDMDFVNHGFFPGPADPLDIPPLIAVVVPQYGWTIKLSDLLTRRRVANDRAILQNKAID